MSRREGVNPAVSGTGNTRRTGSSGPLASTDGWHQTPPPRLLPEVRDAINNARADRDEAPINELGRTPDGKQAYRLAG